MKKPRESPDVLVLGEHPAAYFAAALLKHNSKLRVMHTCVPEEKNPERLVLLNPEFFDLHEMLKPLARKIASRSVYGAAFLGQTNATRSAHRSKSAMAQVASYKQVRDAVKGVADKMGVEFAQPRRLEVMRLDEHGVEVCVGNELLKPKALVLAARLSEQQERMLGLPESWEQGVLHRYSFVKVKGDRCAGQGNRPIVPMSLDLDGALGWAWLLPGENVTQLAIERTIGQAPTGHGAGHSAGHGGGGQAMAVNGSAWSAERAMEHWISLLKQHEVVEPGFSAGGAVESMEMPFAGALAHEGVANRTLLVGPAGGFYSATGEDIYPNCWSALFAADALKKALKETHLQDALQLYRHKWRTTLGEYLRGPQQNLRFLLPLVYRNQVMTTRLTESILLGKSVVR